VLRRHLGSPWSDPGPTSSVLASAYGRAGTHPRAAWEGAFESRPWCLERLTLKDREPAGGLPRPRSSTGRKGTLAFDLPQSLRSGYTACGQPRSTTISSRFRSTDRVRTMRRSPWSARSLPNGPTTSAASTRRDLPGSGSSAGQQRRYAAGYPARGSPSMSRSALTQSTNATGCGTARSGTRPWAGCAVAGTTRS
jgi:hypothetical protein